MTKIKVAHLHTDYKFVIETGVFERDYFDNTIILFENGNPYLGKFKEEAIISKITDKNIKEAVAICNQSDLVVLYGLSPVNQEIALSVKPTVKIAWRFFGFELYGKMPEFCYSEKTIKLLHPSVLQKYLNKIRFFTKTNIRRIVLSREMNLMYTANCMSCRPPVCVFLQCMVPGDAPTCLRCCLQMPS